jgi:hypothetical protein
MARPKYGSLPGRLEAHSIPIPSDLFPGSDCRIWQGYAQDHTPTERGVCGYGHISLYRPGIGSRHFIVHRVAMVLEVMLELKPDFDFYKTADQALFFDLWEAYSRSGLTIDHLCGNSLCINTSHFEWVFMTENLARKYWSEERRKKRIKTLQKKETAKRSQLSPCNDENVQAFIAIIRNKKYRTKE